MTLDLLKRSENGVNPLNQTQHDANFTAIETAVNALCSINGHIETVAVKSYILELKAPTAYTISSLTTDCASGSCTVAVQIDGRPSSPGRSVFYLEPSVTEAETNALLRPTRSRLAPRWRW